MEIYTFVNGVSVSVDVCDAFLKKFRIWTRSDLIGCPKRIDESCQFRRQEQLGAMHTTATTSHDPNIDRWLFKHYRVGQ
jgi:hypothetical protein